MIESVYHSYWKF